MEGEGSEEPPVDHEGRLLLGSVAWYTATGRTHKKGLADTYCLCCMLHILMEVLPYAEVEVPVNVGPLLVDVDRGDL